MPECKKCGSYVSDRFVKVFGNNMDEVHACPSCVRSRGIDAKGTAGMG